MFLGETSPFGWVHFPQDSVPAGHGPWPWVELQREAASDTRGLVAVSVAWADTVTPLLPDEVQAIASMMEKQARIVVKPKEVSQEEQQRKAALLAQYANVTDEEEYPFLALLQARAVKGNTCSKPETTTPSQLCRVRWGELGKLCSLPS